MSSRQTLSVNLTSLAVSATESYWLNIKDAEVLKDTVSLEEAADFIDKLYDLDPCNPDENEGGEAPPQDEQGNIEPPVEEEEFIGLAQEMMEKSVICGAFDGSYECKIRVAKSHRDMPYKLAFDNGEESVRIKTQEMTTQVVSLDDQASVTLDLPVIGNAIYQFDGLVCDKSGICQNPDVTVLGSTVNFGKDITGVLRATYLTEFDLVTVQVYGKDGSADPQPCHVTVFYHGIVVEHDIEAPEKDEQDENDRQRLCNTDDNDLNPTPDGVSCYEIVNSETKCRCSGTVVASEPSQNSVTCPDGITCPGAENECQHFMGSRSVTTGFISCPDEEGLEGTVSDPEYYADKCCEAPDRPLPPCKTITGIFAGGAGISQEDRDAYPGAMFIGIGPKDGVCGETEVRYQVSSINCCDGIPALEWDEAHCAEVVTGLFHVTGGKPPYIWRLSGGDFSFHPELELVEIEESDGWVWVYDLVNACGYGNLMVTDQCNQQLRRYIKAPQGVWLDAGDPEDEFTSEEAKNIILAAGWTLSWDCCTGPWTLCGIDGLSSYEQCASWTASSISYGSEVHPQVIKTDNKYRIRRMTCGIPRCTYCYNACSEGGGGADSPVTTTDPVSGLEFDLLTSRICWTGGDCGEDGTAQHGVGLTNIREIWSCEA